MIKLGVLRCEIILDFLGGPSLSQGPSEVEGERLAILPEITQLTCRSTENLGNLSKLTWLKYKQTAHTDILPKIIELRSESRERSGNLPEITQLRYGSTDRLGYLPLMGWCNLKKTKRSLFLSNPFLSNHSITQ